MATTEGQHAVPVSRRALCKACAEALGLRMQDVAAQRHVACNHLALVLEGQRQGSARLNAALREMILAAKPLLLDARSRLE